MLVVFISYIVVSGVKVIDNRFFCEPVDKKVRLRMPYHGSLLLQITNF